MFLFCEVILTRGKGYVVVKKKYLEIYPMEVANSKISKLLDEVLKEKPNMYSKTKFRYEKLAESLLDNTQKILCILQEEMLVSDTDGEFNDLYSTDDANLSCKIQNLTKKFESIKAFSEHSEITPLKPISSSASADKENLPEEDLKRMKGLTLRFFLKVFEQGNSYNFGYVEVNECAQLIYKWFSTRFFNIPDTEHFVYNMKYIPDWVSGFIIAFGKAYEQNELPDFLSRMSGWITSIQDPKSKTYTYTVPAEIYRITKDEIDPKDFTLSAVIINDILMDKCYYMLMSSEFDNGYINLDAQQVASWVKLYNPILIPEIKKRFANQADIIQRLGFTKVGDMNS